MFDYIPRTLEGTLAQAVKEFPAVLVTGPRQSGKTTLLQHLFGATHRFVSLDEPDLRALARQDPRLFLEEYSPPAILDEIQYAPDLLHYLKRAIDRHRSTKGRYLLSGSQNLSLMQGITETLAGRAAVLTLLSMSHAERKLRSTAAPFWQRPVAENETPALDGASSEELMAGLLRSGYPELVADPHREARLWFASYVQTYLERDVRNLRNVGNLEDFQRFLFALAARTAQLLNVSELARDLGIAVNTAKSWLSVLEASYQIVLLRPYHANLGKRLVRAPKLYFLDAALPAYLAGLTDVKHALFGPMAGPLFENAVFAELYRAFVHRGEMPRLFFWRTAAGHEVDFILDFGRQLIPLEVKLSATPTPPLAANLAAFHRLFPKQAKQSYLVCLTKKAFRLTTDTMALPFEELA